MKDRDDVGNIPLFTPNHVCLTLSSVRKQTQGRQPLGGPGAEILYYFRSLWRKKPADLDPAPDATGVDEQTTFERHLGHVPK